MKGSIQPPPLFEDEEDPPVFLVRGGQVWACWLSGRAPVGLGDDAQVRSAMRVFLHGDAASSSASISSPMPDAPTGPEPVQETARDQQVSDRLEARHDTSIMGKVHTGTGRRDVTILDLSEHGCRFHDRFCNLRPGMPVSLRIGPVGPVRASVKWRRSEYVGVLFESPLYPSVLEHIKDHFDVRGPPRP